jgi:uncharacterized protein
VGREQATGECRQARLRLAALKPEFFGAAIILSARQGRHRAIGLIEGILVAVIFRPLGREALSIISIRPANKKERALGKAHA